MEHPAADLTRVSRGTRERLEIYSELLRKWNTRINLISRDTEEHLWTRHFLDSLQLTRLFSSERGSAVDLGSGGGFPGLVLAIATGRHFHLVEADLRKAAFLREVAAATQAPVTIHAARIEEVATTTFEIVTVRALAALPRLMPMIHRFLDVDGAALVLKGERADAELTECAAKWHMKVERHKSVTDPRGVILRLTEVHRVQGSGG